MPNNHILNTDSIANLKSVPELLIKEKIQFDTFTPKCGRKTTVLLKNIDTDFEEDEVLNELRKHESSSIKFSKVDKFSTTRSKSINTKLPI